MNLDRVDSGRDLPNDFNVIIEIPMNSEPIKYEMDKKTGAMFVDRFMSTAMRYPCNYGYIPHTLSEDKDPVDVLVISPTPLITGVVVRCRPIGLLNMTDEAGEDDRLARIQQGPHPGVRHLACALALRAGAAVAVVGRDDGVRPDVSSGGAA